MIENIENLETNFTIDEIKHPISYIYNDTTSKWDSNKEGYKASCGKQDDVNIYRRMKYRNILIYISNMLNQLFLISTNPMTFRKLRHTNTALNSLLHLL